MHRWLCETPMDSRFRGNDVARNLTIHTMSKSSRHAHPSGLEPLVVTPELLFVEAGGMALIVRPLLLAVIPAKAGIQCAVGFAKRPWIPAYAGMSASSS